MAKIEHLYSTTAGHVPSSLLQGQLAINIPDQIIYANTPDGVVTQISNGLPGVANASALLGSHIPIQFHPVVQFGVGYTTASIGAKFSISGGIATLQPVSVFGLGQMIYTPVLTCPTVTTGNYLLTINLATRVASISGIIPPTPTISGTFNPINNTFSIVFCSETTNIQPWFYMQGYKGVPNGTVGASPGDVSLYRVSTVATFGAIPVSAGFAGANATSYWGIP